jgi:hypothetical protein
VFTTLVTLSEMNTARGAAASNGTSNTGRQGAFSSDGRFYYFADASTQLGGVYKTDVLGGAVTLLFAGDINTEPAVLPLAGGGDRIIFHGTPANGNVGGVNYVDHTGTTTSAEQAFVTAGELADFLERPVGAANVSAAAADAEGNVYFRHDRRCAGAAGPAGANVEGVDQCGADEVSRPVGEHPERQRERVAASAADGGAFDGRGNDAGAVRGDDTAELRGRGVGV